MFTLALSHLGWTEREWERNGCFNRMDGNGSPTAIKRPLNRKGTGTTIPLQGWQMGTLFLPPTVCGIGYGVCGIGYGVCGIGYGVCGIGYGVCGIGYVVWGIGYGV